MLRLWICLCFLAAVSTVKLDKKFIKQVVKSHNKYRTAHQVGPVVESKKLTKMAQRVAERIRKQGSGNGPDSKKYGVTVSYKYKNPNAEGESHVGSLYFFEGYYAAVGLYGKEPSKDGLPIYGPFTQLVWKATKKIGVGKAGEYAVIFYWPKGNKVNKFAKNVLPPKANATVI